MTEPNLTLIDNKKDDPLRKLQRAWAISFIGGEVHVLRRSTVEKALSGGGQQIEFIKKADANLMMGRFLESLEISCSPPKVIAEWWKHPDTRVYDEIAFNPLPMPKSTLNLWIPPQVIPVQGDWQIIDNFLFDVICDKDMPLYLYICYFIAHALQHPDIKPGIMLVLIGAEGVGKGFFLLLIAAIWGKTTIEVSDMAKVVGTFNKDIETKFWILLDEALFKGDFKAQDKLKSLVTEHTVQVEQKHEPSRTIESFHRFVATTNRQQFSQIRTDNRRDVFIRVSDIHKQDHRYFAKLDGALRDGKTVPAFVDSLLKLDLTNFEPRQRPQTTETVEQKILSLANFPRYWHEVLYTGNFNVKELESVYDHNWCEAAHIGSEDLISHYRKYDKTAERHESIQQSTMYATALSMCPSAARKKTKNKWGLSYPDLETARKEFEVYLGSDVKWPD